MTAMKVVHPKVIWSSEPRHREKKRLKILQCLVVLLFWNVFDSWAYHSTSILILGYAAVTGVPPPTSAGELDAGEIQC